MLAALTLTLTQGGGTAASAGVPPPAAHDIPADQAPLTVLQLPAEVLLLVLSWLDTPSLARKAWHVTECSPFSPDTTAWP